ncbi:TetR/AcrR family transcriptional regulator [Mycobacteroides saopaulense]|uniref:TetR family transcriptional regulator n=1 Tax=Mycobacteroides saopaulense TaxID=1578165 RepID=A0A1S1JLP1_9MYCO|nr:TetR/AcrR family transcriptional regulator [Mycobacteroides saopaulense]ALR14423.1 TetR family transcriptional regulator [Mycobacteroides saopaulense]OHT85390.1 TetR family transcriptional regulator [Mycobacteroides saopaulense]OHU11544.1 TetR family transcriptional regulator [Mycobacteroides saopaulense]ORB59365.1 TetR family transcriptional regulator [Mycobacteroides saopaulense]
MGDENDATAPRQRLPKGQGWLLRQQIIDTAMDLILRSGEARAPSARELTRALGITAPSLYRHFSSTDELADALCARYFEQLGEALQRATLNVPTAIERLHALGLAYVRFAAESPLLYRFATASPPRLGSESDEILSSAAFLHLRDVVQELVDEERFPRGSTMEPALQLWATTHGVASLLATRPYLPWGEQELFASRTLRAAYRGQVLAEVRDGADGVGE